MVQVLTNKLISTIRLLVIHTICTKQVEGFCWLFLPNLLNRLKISILQKQKEKKMHQHLRWLNIMCWKVWQYGQQKGNNSSMEETEIQSHNLLMMLGLALLSFYFLEKPVWSRGKLLSQCSQKCSWFPTIKNQTIIPITLLLLVDITALLLHKWNNAGLKAATICLVLA